MVRGIEMGGSEVMSKVVFCPCSNNREIFNGSFRLSAYRHLRRTYCLQPRERQACSDTTSHLPCVYSQSYKSEVSNLFLC